MAPVHPRENWNVSKTDHPGSCQEEIENEPDWEATGHEHYVGYKNRQGRRPGHADDKEYDDVDVDEAWAKLQHMKRRESRGKLVSWKDAIESQKDLSLRHPQGHPHGWRYVLDYTEHGIRERQDWPANIKKRQKQQRQQEQQKPQEQQSQQEQQNNAAQNTAPNARQRDGDQQKTEDSKRSEYDNLREKYSPREIALLRAVQHEQVYMRSLKVNDGTGHSNVRNRTTISIDEADQFTPDNWVPRSPDLIRLTGKHPLNAEAPLSRIFSAGFITPNEIFYVRSHGAVPRLLWEFHQLTIRTFCGKARTFSMDEIKWDFGSINIPVFIGCDNGRRKELNMIKRTKGFNWGPGAVGCAYWKGPLLRKVLLAAGVPEHMPDEDIKRYYVHFQGADNPGAANYETSIPFKYVMDSTNDVILAYEMNDTPLPPDHGYPIRVIIPGYVGGRQVKWLQKVWISDQENDSYYHIWDNRAVPSFVTTTEDELAMTMFHHPETALYEQYLNSVITVPAQGEKISLADVRQGQEYRIQGFAFNGQGDEIRRIEVTLDEGKTWLYCIRKFPEAPIRHGKKFWTWCFWHVDVEIGDLIAASSIRVRAWDTKMLAQPEQMTWNILGSMNNVQYVLKPELCSSDSSPHYLFRHPVEPANLDGGWMKESMENQLGDASKKVDVPKKEFTRLEIEKHDQEDDCWIVVDGRVYDATSVLSWHPGGAAPIMMHAGAVHYDTTTEFSSLHDDYAYEKLNGCILGVVTDKAEKHIAKTKKDKEESAVDTPPDQALQKHRWVPVTLAERRWITGDTAVYKFSLPNQAPYLGLGTCQHVEIGFHLRDRLLIRPYTPTKPVFPRQAQIPHIDDDALVDGSGSFEMTVKTYFPDGEQPGGAMSNVLAELAVGQGIEMRGPTGDIIYMGQGKFDIVGKERAFKRVSLVLGGTGLTPGYSLLARVCRDPNDLTGLRVIDANKSEEDVLLSKELKHLEDSSKGQLKISHMLSHPTKEWEGLKGHVTDEILRDNLYEPSEENLVLLCGPPAMIENAVVPALEKWGYDQNSNMFGL